MRTSFNPFSKFGVPPSVGPTSCLKLKTLNSSAFTLMELLLAVALFAVVLASINAVFFSAMRLQRTAQAAIDRSLPANRAAEIIRQDLRNIALPGGTMAGSFQFGVNTTNNAAQGSLDFTTSTGVIEATVPFSELQRVTYELRDSGSRSSGGKELVRTARRNLLPVTTEQAGYEVILSNVRQMQVSFYNGAQWVETWDSTTATNALPSGIRMELSFAADQNGGIQSPMRLTAPILAVASTNDTQAAGGTN